MAGDGFISSGAIRIDPVAPGLFTANANGQGVAAAVALRVKADGTQIFEPVAQWDETQNRFVSLPIDLGPAGGSVNTATIAGPARAITNGEEAAARAVGQPAIP